MERVVQKLVALGVPGLVLLVVMGTTGLAGGAAIVAALAALGGPLGILGGLGVLGILTLVSNAIAEYGIEAIFEEVLRGLRVRGYSEEQIRRIIASYPITRNLERKLFDYLDRCSFRAAPEIVPPTRNNNSSAEESPISLEQRVIEIIAAVLIDEVGKENIHLDSYITEDLMGVTWIPPNAPVISDLYWYDLIAWLEDEFSVEIPDEQLDEVRTVADLVALIQRLQNEKSRETPHDQSAEQTVQHLEQSISRTKARGAAEASGSPLEQKVIDIIAGVLGYSRKTTIRLDSEIEDDLGATIEDYMDIGAFLESEFHLEIPDDQWDSLLDEDDRWGPRCTVGDIVALIQRLQSEELRQPRAEQSQKQGVQHLEEGINRTKPRDDAEALCSPVGQEVIDMIAGLLPGLKKEYIHPDWIIGHGFSGDFQRPDHMVGAFKRKFNLTDDQAGTLLRIIEQNGTVGDVVAFLEHAQSKENEEWTRNTLHILAPYRYDGTWVFDDPSRGLKREPFPAGIPQMIDLLLTVKGMENVDRFRLIFSQHAFSEYDERIDLTYGQTELLDNRAWTLYFNEPPKQIYVKFEPSDQPHNATSNDLENCRVCGERVSEVHDKYLGVSGFVCKKCGHRTHDRCGFHVTNLCGHCKSEEVAEGYPSGVNESREPMHTYRCKKCGLEVECDYGTSGLKCLRCGTQDWE